MRRILMIAFHYPPFQGGSGVHRTLKFSKYLPEHGWRPIVLSAHPRAYSSTGTEQLTEIPREAVVQRSFALATARHLSLNGRYLRIMALPDQWSSWYCSAVLTGLKLVWRYRPSIIFSTYPIATAHLIGLTLQRLTQLPWIADFRDSMTEEGYPRDVWTRRVYKWIEKQTVLRSSRTVFTTNLTKSMYEDRYPDLSSGRFSVIQNGYDEEDFSGLKSASGTSANGRPIRLVHAGVIYTDDRDPKGFFRVLGRLKKERRISARDVLVDLRASGSENYYATLLQKFDIADIVRLLPPIAYREALQDCAQADALVLFQAASCNHQIPAKVYEYLRLGKHILALTPVVGDTGALLSMTGGATIVDLQDEAAIYKALPTFIDAMRTGKHELPNPSEVARFSRRSQAADLAECLNNVLGDNCSG
jgi:glycosyltransferase involved in cell wall biosynthesis